MNYVALICARGGSKGLPGKNLLKLSGRPLIGWAIKVALETERISRVIVSTDSLEIAQTARQQGAEVPFIRPPELASDNSPEWKVWRHALEFLAEQKESLDGLVVVPPTAPLRSTEDVENCIKTFEETGSDVVLTITDSARSPYFNMVKKDEYNRIQLVIPPTTQMYRRQDVPEVFDITTVTYVVRPEFVYSANGIFDGSVYSVYVPPERAIDIDTALDFQMAQCIANLSKET